MIKKTAWVDEDSTADDRVSIRAREVTFDEAEARKRIQSPPSPGLQIKHRLVGVDVASIDISYKPFYAFDTVLQDEGYFGGDDDKEGFVVVDAVTGIARARPDGYATVEEISVPPSALAARELDETEALEAAREFQIKLEHRESREARIDGDGTKLYKPVWVATLDTGDRCVVDAVNGELFSDVSLWQVLPFRS
jgi:hypothetical protein